MVPSAITNPNRPISLPISFLSNTHKATRACKGTTLSISQGNRLIGGLWRSGNTRGYCSQGCSGTRMSAVGLQPSLAVKSKAAEIVDELKGTSIFLVGMKSSLKTNAGKVLADVLRYYFFDSDSLVTQAAGSACDAESFKRTDEQGFNESETEVLKQLSSMGRLVVCTGDGAVGSITNLALLRYGISIWIDTPLDTLATEILKSRTPHVSQQELSRTDSFLEVMDELNRRHEDLREGYATADTTISVQRLSAELGYEDLGSVTPEDVALEALKKIEKLTRVKKMMEEAAKPF